MSRQGEPSPRDFDFTVDVADQLTYYDPERIAEEAVWPAVDEIWGGDWRGEAKAGHKLRFPSSGVHDHVELTVNLKAFCFLLERGEVTEPDITKGVAVIELEERVSPAEEARIINEARGFIPETIDSYKEGALRATKGTCFTFDMEDGADINAFLVVEDLAGNIVWSSEDYEEWEADVPSADEADEELVIAEEDGFTVEDVERIAVALSIIGAPEQCLKALEALKQEPIKFDEIETDG